MAPRTNTGDQRGATVNSMPHDIVCIDAPVAGRLVLPEEDSEAAITLWQNWRETGIRVVAPSLIVWEVANSIRKTVRCGRLPMAAADAIFETFLSLQITTRLLRSRWEQGRAQSGLWLAGRGIIDEALRTGLMETVLRSWRCA
jgi:hypothetical protein